MAYLDPKKNVCPVLFSILSLKTLTKKNRQNEEQGKRTAFPALFILTILFDTISARQKTCEK